MIRPRAPARSNIWRDELWTRREPEDTHSEARARKQPAFNRRQPLGLSARVGGVECATGTRLSQAACFEYKGL